MTAYEKAILAELVKLNQSLNEIAAEVVAIREILNERS